MTREYRYTGPDGAGIADPPDGVGAALGSEYCVHLLPGPARLAEVVGLAAARKIPLLLLTSYFRDPELERIMPIFEAIPEGTDIEVAVNDWGLLSELHSRFPWLKLSLGRLLSQQKRCPRIEVSSRLTSEEKSWHGEGMFSSEWARDYLRDDYGLSDYNLDVLPWGDTTAGIFHVPYAIVTVSDFCPWIGSSSSAITRCARPCRKGCVALSEPSMGREMVQRGKARFVDYGADVASVPDPSRVAFYADVP